MDGTRRDSRTITRITRRALSDLIADRRVEWWGRLEEHEFLNRLYDLSRIPSLYYNGEDAEHDIRRHRYANYDFPDDYPFTDERFELLDGPDGTLLRFLAEVVHPEVRADESEARELVVAFNALLRRDGWQLVEESTVSGRPVYVGRPSEGRPVDAPEGFPTDPEQLVASMVTVLKERGAAREVGVILASEPTFAQSDYEDQYDRGARWILTLGVDLRVYSSLSRDERVEIESLVREVLKEFLEPLGEIAEAVVVAPGVAEVEGWRSAAREWLAGAGLTNQGRVRSDNIASRQCDGLLFRSQPEIHLYRALKRRGVTFAPLPVFLRGGDGYSRLEPDFVLIKDGVLMVVEVDGDTYHRENPAEAAERLEPLRHEGANVERLRASECATREAAEQSADRLLGVLDRIARRRR